MAEAPKPTLFIAGGGTGGHIYPGIAIARAMQQLQPNLEIHFVGTNTGLETKIIPKEGFPLHFISGGKLNFSGRPLEKLKTLLKLPWGFVQSAALLSKLKPQFVLGVGGYASAPMVLTASILGFPTAIWEPNAHPGLANRWLSRFVKKCFTVFSEAQPYLHCHDIARAGMPVRAEIESKTSAATQPASDKFRILCFGGSQGARAINHALANAVVQGGPWLTDVEIVHQIGALDFKFFDDKYRSYKNIVTPMEFIFDMPKYYAWADLVICRGGASTLAEVAAFGVPPLVIPLPLADGHQQKNAESFVKANAGAMILQQNLSPEHLVEEILKLKNNSQLRSQMSKNLKTLFEPKAAHRIAEDILRAADAP